MVPIYYGSDVEKKYHSPDQKKKTQASKTSMASKHNFKAPFGVFLSYGMQIVLFFQSISFH